MLFGIHRFDLDLCREFGELQTCKGKVVYHKPSLQTTIVRSIMSVFYVLYIFSTQNRQGKIWEKLFFFSRRGWMFTDIEIFVFFLIFLTKYPLLHFFLLPFLSSFGEQDEKYEKFFGSFCKFVPSFLFAPNFEGCDKSISPFCGWKRIISYLLLSMQLSMQSHVYGMLKSLEIISKKLVFSLTKSRTEMTLRMLEKRRTGERENSTLSSLHNTSFSKNENPSIDSINHTISALTLRRKVVIFISVEMPNLIIILDSSFPFWWQIFFRSLIFIPRFVICVGGFCTHFSMYSKREKVRWTLYRIVKK